MVMLLQQNQKSTCKLYSKNNFRSADNQRPTCMQGKHGPFYSVDMGS